MNLEQLFFTWKGRQLVLALFAGMKVNKTYSKDPNSYVQLHHSSKVVHMLWQVNKISLVN